MDARLALRTSEERARALHGRADSLLRAARAEREARARAAERRERLLREGRAAEAVGLAVGYVLSRLEVSIDRAAEARAAVEQARAGREQELRDVRAALRDLGREHDELVNSVHRDEMARTQQRMRIEQLEERALEELGLDADGLVADYGPDQLVPFSGEVEEGEEHARARAVRPRGAAEAAAHRRARAARCSAGSTRSRSRSSRRWRSGTSSSPSSSRTSRKTRKDLLDIVREVDERVEQVFTEAYADVSTAFDSTFARLFPGGEGRLVLTDPDDMLNTGIEVEARPAGKKVKRLSLLSGGERSLVAVASWSRCSRPGRRRSTSSTRSRPRSTTPTSAGCWRSTRSCARTPSCS